jgi:ring-1,2-phenylacetyl-CoA epoxidase subunit PaaB
MNDTQWRRFEVFVQEKPGTPYLDVGSVHAPDAEMALLNARDVFARRPAAISMWVVPTTAIYSKTAQELNDLYFEQLQLDAQAEDAEPYYVFCKAKSAGTQTLLGTVEAISPAQAMQQAVAAFSGEKAPFAWWVFPVRYVTPNDPQDADSLYAPAHEKSFRMSTDFHTYTAMRSLKK